MCYDDAIGCTKLTQEVEMARIASLKVRKRGGHGTRPAGYGLSLPRELGELIPDDQEFRPELVEEGILYRRVERPTQSELPSWVKQGDQ
jgi:hypothetical protein